MGKWQTSEKKNSVSHATARHTQSPNAGDHVASVEKGTIKRSTASSRIMLTTKVQEEPTKPQRKRRKRKRRLAKKRQ